MHDDRTRLPDGTIVNDDGSVIPPIDPDLMARLEQAQDADGVIRDATLADEYFDALVQQGEEVRRLAGLPDPVIEDGRVFPSTSEDEPPLP